MRAVSVASRGTRRPAARDDAGGVDDSAQAADLRRAGRDRHDRRLACRLRRRRGPPAAGGGHDEDEEKDCSRTQLPSHRQAQRLSILIVWMTTSVSGRSRSLVAVLPIFWTTSMPSTTSPNTLWRSSRWASAERDEELPAVGVGAAVRHRENARLVVPRLRMELVREGIAGPPIPCRAGRLPGS